MSFAPILFALFISKENDVKKLNRSKDFRFLKLDNFFFDRQQKITLYLCLAKTSWIDYFFGVKLQKVSSAHDGTAHDRY